MKQLDIDNADLGLWAFMVAIIGLVVAISLKAVSEPTFLSLFSSCLVGIGSLANPNLGKFIKRKQPEPDASPNPVGDLKT